MGKIKNIDLKGIAWMTRYFHNRQMIFHLPLRIRLRIWKQHKTPLGAVYFTFVEACVKDSSFIETFFKGSVFKRRAGTELTN